MALQKCQVSSQYLRKGEIAVTILDIRNPVHFVVKECPSLDASPEAKRFVEAEAAMQKYYKSVDPGFFQFPLKDAIIVARFKDKFYRAKVIRILSMSAGHLFQVYLVDYGIECSLERNCIYEIEKDFLIHPFQSIEFKLLGLEPISLVMDSVSLTMSYGPVSCWDLSADTFVKDLQKRMCSAYIQVQAVDKEYIYGKLFFCFSNSIPKCVNDELISNKFAQFNEDCWKIVRKIESFVENNHAGNGNFEVESLISTRSNLKQMSSPTKPSTMASCFSDSRMMFVRPSDGKVIAGSSLTEKFPVNVERDCQSEVLLTSNCKIVDESILECGSLSSPQCVENVPRSKVCKEPKSPLSASESNTKEQKNQTIAQQRLLKLQQLHKKQLQSPILLSNAQNPTVKNPSVHIGTTANIKQLTSNVPAEKLTDTQKLSLIDASRKTVHDKTVSSGNKSNSHDSCQSNNLNSTISENKLKQESMTKEQLIAHKRFLKLQQSCRKKLQSSLCLSDGNFSCMKSSSSMKVNIDNGPNTSANRITNGVDHSVESTQKKQEESLNYHFSTSESHITSDNDCTKSNNESSQSDVVNNSVEISGAPNLKSKEKSEVVLEHVKTLQKLQNRIRLKQSLPVLEKSNGLKFENKSALSNGSDSNLTNENQRQSISSTPTLLTEKISQ